MKKLFYLIIFFIITSCTSNKTVYWCGDHPCISKKEKKDYFKKMMIVEIKELKKEDLKNNYEIEKIIQQAEVNEKIIIKEERKSATRSKFEKKQKIKQEKILTKQAKLEEKRRLKERKILTKQAKLEEKRRLKEEKVLVKQIESDEKKILKSDKKLTKETVAIEKLEENIEMVTTNFDKLVKKITTNNAFRPYPNINDIPN